MKKAGFEIKDQDLFYGSLKGLAEAVGDPYTVFMDPKESKQFTDDLAGTFEGIGAEVGIRNDITTVISPLDGMPAQKVAKAERIVKPPTVPAARKGAKRPAPKAKAKHKKK